MKAKPYPLSLQHARHVKVLKHTTTQKSSGISKLCASWIHSLEPRILGLKLCFQTALSIYNWRDKCNRKIRL